jgi:alkylation response protein AidB-like acyl-CoA dehydrogenase
MSENHWIKLVRDVGPGFAAHAAKHDVDGSFVAENIAVLREKKVLSAMVPADLGGGGATHGEMCELLRELAHYDSSTALTLSMHQHLVGFQRYNHEHGKPGKAVLEKVAQAGVLLISTGARDYLASSGRIEKVDGGYKVWAKKGFSSGSPSGGALVTSAPYKDPAGGWQVFHFSVPFSAQGVRVEQDWNTMGMRGTGSNTVVLDGVFVAEDTVGLRRPRGPWHPAWAVILSQAMPLISSVYVGTAEAALEIAKGQGPKRKDDPLFHIQLGDAINSVTTARMALDSMVKIVNNFDYPGSNQVVSEILSRKTIAARAAIDGTTKAFEAVGGGAYYRSMGLERLMRDVFAAQFHPFPDKKQQLFTGRVAIGLEPPAEPFDPNEQ